MNTTELKLLDLAPFIIGAHVQWLDESGAQPHLVIMNGEHVKFPPHLASQPAVTFDISAGAVQGLHIDESGVSFTGRFGGATHTVFAPLTSLAHLRSKDGTVGLELNSKKHEPEPSADPEVLTEQPDEVLEAVRDEHNADLTPHPALTIIKGDGKGDGIPRGKLTLV